MLLYIHVPFCRRKCHYCAFYSEPLAGSSGAVADMALPCSYTDQSTLGGTFGAAGGADADPGMLRMQLWTDHLLLEMAQWGDRLGRMPVSTIFFGGGTPSLVPPDIIATILNRARRCFRVDAKAEISMEANPESLTRTNAKQYLRAGINRVSLGVQALDDSLLHFMGRVHTVKDVMRAYNSLRAANCHNVSLDFIWGLPGQSVAAWLSQLGEIVRLKPEHLSLYGLTLEPGTPMSAMYEEGGFELPTERNLATMYVRGAELLEEAGFLHYEVSNFSRMGYQCRHNMGYWEGEDYLGLGPSATSTMGGRRWTNPSGLGLWAEAVRSHTCDAQVENLSLTDRVLELLMLRLRTTRGLRVKAYRELTGRDFLRDHQALVHALHRHRLIRIRNGYMWLTRNGMLVSNSILERFFEATREHLERAAYAASVRTELSPDPSPLSPLSPLSPDAAKASQMPSELSSGEGLRHKSESPVAPQEAKSQEAKSQEAKSQEAKSQEAKSQEAKPSSGGWTESGGVFMEDMPFSLQSLEEKG